MKKLNFLVGVSWDTLGHPINSRLRKSWKDNYRAIAERRFRKMLANFRGLKCADHLSNETLFELRGVWITQNNKKVSTGIT